LPAWTRLADGLQIAVRVTPRSAKESIAAGEDHFRVRLRAPPVEGAANDALVHFIATQFDLAKRDVAIVAGETARLKRIRLTGAPERLENRARSLYSPCP